MRTVKEQLSYVGFVNIMGTYRACRRSLDLWISLTEVELDIDVTRA